MHIITRKRLNDFAHNHPETRTALEHWYRNMKRHNFAFLADVRTVFGKILRIDVDSAEPYAVPADNPFVQVESARGEIWSYGFRNPWRFSFDRGTGDMWIADVGDAHWEEVDYQPAASTGG